MSTHEPVPAAITDAPDEHVLRQPIGYWTGEAHRLIGESLRRALRSNGLTQPQWWILNALAPADGPTARTELLDSLAPFNANEQDRDLDADLEDLLDRGLVTEQASTLRISDEGRAARDRSVVLNGDAHRAMLRGVADDHYVVTINALRQIIANLGGSSDVY